MQTSELPKAVEQLKKDINKILVDFNKATGLDIAEIHAQGLSVKQLDGEQRIGSYDVGVGIDL